MKTKKLFFVITVLFCNLFLTKVTAMPFAGGTGTSANPYLIETPAQFDSIRGFRSSYFKLNADLDFANYTRNDGGDGVWFPVAEWGSGNNSTQRFSGNFNGSGHVIKNLKAVRSDAWDYSLFGVIDGGKISKLILQDCEFTGSGRMGVLCGSTFRATIDQVIVINSKCISNGNGTNSPHAGGITGPLHASVVTNSYSLGGTVYSTDCAGGIASAIENDGASYVIGCYSTSSIEASNHTGGIVGGIFSTTSKIKNCLALNKEIINNDPITGSARIVAPDATGLENNYGWDELNINAHPVIDNNLSNQINGQDVTSTELSSVDFYANSLLLDIVADPDDPTAQIWKFDTSIFKYPVLVWQMSMPDGFTSAVPVVKTIKHTVINVNNVLQISDLNIGEIISVYTTSGVLVTQKVAATNNVSIPLKNKGVFIVKTLSDVTKIIN